VLNEAVELIKKKKGQNGKLKQRVTMPRRGTRSPNKCGTAGRGKRGGCFGEEDTERQEKKEAEKKDTGETKGEKKMKTLGRNKNKHLAESTEDFKGSKHAINTQ
jgi:hypothetical protein